MKIEELSVGDWVRAKLAKWDYDSPEETEPMRIVCIDNSEPKQAFVDMIGPGMVKHSALIDDLRPIPLTPEILEKNGFELLALNKRRWENQSLAIAAVRDNEKGCWIICEADLNRRVFFEMCVDNIHEFQHILRLLGVKKEVCL